MKIRIVFSMLLPSIFLIIVFLLAPNARAQQTLGGITGTVTDSSGAVISGATVTLVGNETKLNRTQTTSATGVVAPCTATTAALKSGDVVVASEVMDGDTRWLADLALNEEMIANVALGRRRVVRGGLAGVERARDCSRQTYPIPSSPLDGSASSS